MSDILLKWESLSFPILGLSKSRSSDELKAAASAVHIRRKKTSRSPPRQQRRPSGDDDRRRPVEEKKSLSWWPVRPVDVLDWHQVTEAVREPGIYSGYRKEEATIGECVRSLFSPTNETLNFWTHFFPTILFIWRTYKMAQQWNFLPDDTNSLLNPAPDLYAQPFLVFMITACMYPLASAVAHGFSALSPNARAVCFFADYAAISFYSYGSGLLYRAYVIPDSWMEFSSVFLAINAVISLVSTGITCYSRCFVRCILIQRLLRLAAFTMPYIWVSIPLFLRLIFGLGDGKEYEPTADRLHLAQIFFALLASFCYSSHLPERVLPGKFDYCGHSHNLLHICGVVATTLQLEGSLVDMNTRRSGLMANGLAMMDSYWWTGVVPLTLFIGHVLLVAGFGRLLYHLPPEENGTTDNNNCCSSSSTKLMKQ